MRAAILIMANCFIGKGFLLFVSLNAQLLRTSKLAPRNCKNSLRSDSCNFLSLRVVKRFYKRPRYTTQQIAEIPYTFGSAP